MPPPGVVLLFRHGARPDVAAVHALAANGGFALTEEPGAASRPADRLELLVNGLTFDLLGLAGSTAAAVPPARHSFGLVEVQADALQAVALVPGPHLVGGQAMMPVVRSQLALAVRLAALPGLVAVAWAPAHSWMGPDYFVAAVSTWLEGGVFPALGLTAVVGAPDGGLQSDGLTFFTGQELRIEPELADDKVAATRLAVRLLNELVANDPVTERVEFMDPEGRPLVLEPSGNRCFVRVRTAE